MCPQLQYTSDYEDEFLSRLLQGVMNDEPDRKVIAVFDSRDDLISQVIDIISDGNDFTVHLGEEPECLKYFIAATDPNHIMFISMENLLYSGMDTSECTVALCTPFATEPQYVISPRTPSVIAAYFHSPQSEFLWRWSASNSGVAHGGLIVCPYSRKIFESR